MQASMDLPPAKAEPEAEAAAAVTAPPGKPEKATTVTKAARPTTLLDVQEVEWFTRELERLLAREHQSGDDDAGAAGRHRRKRARNSPAPRAAHKAKGSFLADLLGRHAVSICSGDAVDNHSSAAAGACRRGRQRAAGRRRGGGFREVEKV